MEAQLCPFPKIINGVTQFVIPVFQRDYSWSEENCRQLWQDILLIGDKPTEKSHFLGSIVYIPTGDISAGFTRWLLIDGQQRVTTLILLLTALRDHIRKYHWTGTEDGPTARRIEAYFLRNVLEEGDKEVKLRLRRHDDATLQSLIFRTELKNRSEKVQENYELFLTLLENADLEKVYRGINRLNIVDVSLTRGVDDPQLIFESLNSTGVDLSSSDLIRNFILMSLSEKDQTRLYQTYWSKIDDLFQGRNGVFDNFIRDYLALRTRPSKLERADRVYNAFRRVFLGVTQDVGKLEVLLKDLLRRANQYAAFTIGSGVDERSRAFEYLRHLGDVPAILVMRLLEAHEVSGTLNEADLLEAIRLLESYMLRRNIIGAQNKGYSIEFAKVAYRIDDEQPLASMKAAMALMPSAYSFPEDEEFRKALVEGNLYHKRVCRHLLQGLENRDSKEQSDTRAYSIEHILPQNENLPEAWRKMLGADWKSVQQTWLHRLGNLTLTGYNSTYKDKPLSEKQTITNGFQQSSVRLNQDVRDAPTWGPKEIAARGERLSKRALAIWPKLNADTRLIQEMELADIKARAARSSTDQVEMTQEAKALFLSVQSRIKDAFPDAIETAEKKSVSYHAPEFFLEVIPRKRELCLLVAIEYNEVENPDDSIEDTSDLNRVVNAIFQGGVRINLQAQDKIDQAMRVITQAHTLVNGA